MKVRKMHPLDLKQMEHCVSLYREQEINIV